MPVKIHGKEYSTVAERINQFYEEHPESGDINTSIVQFDTEKKLVIVKATLRRYIGDKVLEYSDYAQETIGSSNINKTSALENCCTSAIGRALAAAGYHGTEYASANEVTQAISQQESTSYTLKAPKANADDFDFSTTQASNAATEKQLATMEKCGIDFDPSNPPSKQEASRMIGEKLGVAR